MVQTAIQLYTLRDLDEPVSALVARTAETTFDGVQFAGLGDESPADVASALDDHGLAGAGAHVDIDAVEDDPAGVAETYAELGVDTLVVPYLPRDCFESESAAADTADRLTDLAGELADHGATLAYHNHDHEFVDVGDRTGLEAVVERSSDVAFELDLGWALAGGVDPAAFLRRHADRVPFVHAKDVAPAPDREGWASVELGTGELDLPACIAAARDADVAWVVYEHDEPADPEASLAHGARKLDDLLDR